MRLLFRTYKPTRRQNLLTLARRISIWVSRECILHMSKFQGYLFKPLVSLSAVLLCISGDVDDAEEKESKQEFNVLCDWIKQQLGDKVAKVQVSKRLSSSPCVLVSGKFGWSANMERCFFSLSFLPTYLLFEKLKLIIISNTSLFKQAHESTDTRWYIKLGVHERTENFWNQPWPSYH